jgi:hypothetical protein
MVANVLRDHFAMELEAMDQMYLSMSLICRACGLCSDTFAVTAGRALPPRLPSCDERTVRPQHRAVGRRRRHWSGFFPEARAQG